MDARTVPDSALRRTNASHSGDIANRLPPARPSTFAVTPHTATAGVYATSMVTGANPFAAVRRGNTGHLLESSDLVPPKPTRRSDSDRFGISELAPPISRRPALSGSPTAENWSTAE